MTTSYQVRFGVRDEQGRCSTVWTLWCSSPKKSDVYLAPREVAKSMKFSFHESDNWQISLTEPYFEEVQSQLNRPMSSRHLLKWLRPATQFEDLTLAFRIMIPTSELRKPSATVAQQKPVTWLPAPPAKHVAQFLICFGIAIDEKKSFLEESQNITLVEKKKLVNNQYLYLCYASTPEDSDISRTRNEANNRQFSQSEIYTPLKTDVSLVPGGTLFQVGIESDGAGFVLELAT